MRPSAARVRSHVISKLSDWIKDDKIIVVLLYTCGKQNLTATRFESLKQTGSRAEFLTWKLTRQTTRKNTLQLFTGQLNIPWKYVTHFRFPFPPEHIFRDAYVLTWHIACLFSNYRKFKFTSTKTDIFSSFSSEGGVKSFKTLINCKKAKKWIIFTAISMFQLKPGAKNPLPQDGKW